MLIGIDDTDSLKGGCTTYLAALLYEKLGTTKYPKLIRLNPNIPYKTRGNGAVTLETKKEPGKIKETTLNLVKKHAHLKEQNTNPGIIFIEKPDQKQKKILNKFYQKTLTEHVTLKEAEETARKINAQTHKFNNGRGIIGALAAIGADLGKDKTYELIAYRKKENYGKKKKINTNSVYEMNQETYPQTFDNIDPETQKILITPHGYDPVFCGIRGNTPQAVEKAWDIIKPLEEIIKTQIFETNQATDAHLTNKKISELKAYDCAILKGNIIRKPKTIEGSHVIFGLEDNSGKIDCAAYQPTGKLRDTTRKLIPGDTIKAYGGIGKYPNTLNLEKIQILKLEETYERIPPECCGKKMTSAGKHKGFKCRKCGKKQGEETAILKKTPRELSLGFYEVPPRARRHLSKPQIRTQH